MRTLILFAALGTSVFYNFQQFYENARVRGLAYNCEAMIQQTNENIKEALDLIDKYEIINRQTERVEKMLANKVRPEQLNRYATAFLNSSIKYKIPVRLLITIASVESNFNQYAISNKGALGLMQIMPLWVKINPDLSSTNDLFNLEKNIDAGAFVLAQYRERFGHYRTTITAYNRGERRVARILAIGMDPSNVYTTRVLSKWNQNKKNYL